MNPVIILIVISAIAIFIKKFSCHYKVIFLIYLILLIIGIYDMRTRMIIFDELSIVKLLILGPGLFIFLTIMSFISKPKLKKKVLYFFLEYGLLYFLMVLFLKIFVYLITILLSSRNSDFKSVDFLITILPYKWVLFIIVVLIYNKYYKNKNIFLKMIQYIISIKNNNYLVEFFKFFCKDRYK